MQKIPPAYLLLYISRQKLKIVILLSILESNFHFNPLADIL